MWHKVQRLDRVQEYFLKGAYIQSDTWNASQPPKFDPEYPYIKDEEFIQNRSNVPVEIRVSEITHVTICKNMMSILEDGGFRSRQKIIPDFELCDFVWFGMKIGEEEIINIKEHFKLQQLMPNTVHFACSPAFQPKSRYGNFKFTFGIQDVIDAYKSQYCPVLDQRGLRSDPEFRKLGTFAYKQKVMHVVLVCPTGTPLSNSCPFLWDDLTPVIQQDIQNPNIWIWRPHSTGDKYVAEYGCSRRWEHVAFAFHVPKGFYFRLTNLEHHLSLCVRIDLFQGGILIYINDAISEMIHAIQGIPSIFKRKILFNMMIRMIRGYLDDEPLYEITGNLFNVEYKSVSLGSVYDSSRDILQGEDFDWWPLIEWMKSVKNTNKNKQAHSFIFKYLSQVVQNYVPLMQEHFI